MHNLISYPILLFPIVDTSLSSRYSHNGARNATNIAFTAARTWYLAAAGLGALRFGDREGRATGCGGQSFVDRCGVYAMGHL